MMQAGILHPSRMHYRTALSLLQQRNVQEAELDSLSNFVGPCICFACIEQSGGLARVRKVLPSRK